MKTVFADTGYWHATVDPADQLHETATAISQKLGPVRFLTTEMVLDELLATLRAPATRSIAIRAVQTIMSNPNVEVVPQTSSQFHEALRTYSDRLDKEWSLTDCASFNLMNQRGIREALAHDKHFEQAGFSALLRSHE